jgi:hypothetical protein
MITCLDYAVKEYDNEFPFYFDYNFWEDETKY